MSQHTTRPAEQHAIDVHVEEFHHPVGTLAIVAVYGALFALGWLLVYFLVYVPRGTVTP